MTISEIIEEIKTIACVTDKWDDSYDFECYDDDDKEIFTLVEDDDWTQEHKSQYRCQIWYYPARDVYFQVIESREGSYHTDWYYSPPDIDIVSKHEKEVTRIEVEWKIVKDESKSKCVPVPKAKV